MIPFVVIEYLFWKKRIVEFNIKDHSFHWGKVILISDFCLNLIQKEFWFFGWFIYKWGISFNNSKGKQVDFFHVGKEIWSWCLICIWNEICEKNLDFVYEKDFKLMWDIKMEFYA